MYLVVITVPFTLLFVKITFFLLYYQVFRPLRWLRITVYVGATLTAAFYGASDITQMVLVTPHPGETWVARYLSPESHKTIILAMPIPCVGLVIDLFILTIPIVAVFGLKLPNSRKIGVLCIFMFGLL